MNVRTLLPIILLIISATGYAKEKRIMPPAPYGVIPSKDQVEWNKMEYYMFIHFGPNTFTNREWGNGNEDPKVFNPKHVDCKQWVATAKAAGMKGVILTVKHHDGFCLWPSKYSKHTIRESPWKHGKGDLVKELSSACKEYGLKFGIYLSPWDRNHPAYGTPTYNKVFAAMLGEVLGNYGDIFEQWFDGANGEGEHGKKQIYDWNMFHQVVHKYQPHASIFSDVGPGCRWIGNERGCAGFTNWSRLDIKGYEPGKGAPQADTLNMGNMHGAAWVPAEADVSIRPGWFYSPSTNNKLKSLDQLLNIYYTSVGRNANLILNVPPDRSGRIHKLDSIRLMQFKAALDRVFATNLMDSATIKASNERGSEFVVSNLMDKNYDSYWATEDNITKATLDVDLHRRRSFNRLMLQEYIPLGQRIAAFSVYYWGDNAWKLVKRGTTIGYKRILRFPTISSQKIRISIDKSLACPILNNIGLYNAPNLSINTEISRSIEGIVSIYCKNGDAKIYYTIDGTMPSTHSKIYKNSFNFPKKGAIRTLTILDSSLETEIKNFDILPTKWKITSPKTITKEYQRAIFDLENHHKTLFIPKSIPLTISFGEVLSLRGLSYIPSTDKDVSNIYKCIILGSLDGQKWFNINREYVFDNIKNNPIIQHVEFGHIVKASFIKIEVHETTESTNKYSISGFQVSTE